jgi:hypothetical protein
VNGFRRYTTALALACFATAGCVTEVVTPTQVGVLDVEMLQSSVPLWSVVNLRFTNRGTLDIYVRPQCGSMKRKYGNEWRTPESLMPLTNCASGNQVLRRLPPGQSITEPLKVWSETPSNTDITGEFRLWYQFSESADPHSPRYQTGTASFLVMYPPD